MRLDSLLLAEDVGRDGRNALTLIGVNQNILFASQLPTTARTFMVGHISVDYPPGESLTFTVRVTAPDGESLQAPSGTMNLQERRFAALPGAIELPIELRVELKAHGTYRFSLAVDGPGGDHVERDLEFYVMDPAEGGESPLAGGTDSD